MSKIGSTGDAKEVLMARRLKMAEVRSKSETTPRKWVRVASGHLR
jgi:hypothetical protein